MTDMEKSAIVVATESRDAVKTQAKLLAQYSAELIEAKNLLSWYQNFYEGYKQLANTNDDAKKNLDERKKEILHLCLLGSQFLHVRNLPAHLAIINAKIQEYINADDVHDKKTDEFDNYVKSFQPLFNKINEKNLFPSGVDGYLQQLTENVGRCEAKCAAQLIKSTEAANSATQKIDSSATAYDQKIQDLNNQIQELKSNAAEEEERLLKQLDDARARRQHEEFILQQQLTQAETKKSVCIINRNCVNADRNENYF